MRRTIALIICGLALLASFPVCAAETRERLMLYRVERIAKENAPVIDGTMTEAVWQNKAQITNLRNFRGSRVGDVASQKSEYTILTDGKKIYIGATFFEESMQTLKCDPSKAPFWNDCIEIYFDPRHDGTRSIQLVVDCGNQRMWERRFDDGYGWWSDSSWYMLADWESAVSKGPDAWYVEIKIDCASFGFDPKPGTIIGFNPCRFRFSTGDQEFSAWGFDMFSAGSPHKASNAWGHLLFGEPDKSMKGLPVTTADVRKVYPSLEGKVVEVPIDGGLTIYSANGEETKTFKEMLTPVVDEASASLDEAKAMIAELANTNPQKTQLSAQVTQQETNIANLRIALNEPNMTMGAFDRMSDQFNKASTDCQNLLWTAKLSKLINN